MKIHRFEKRPRRAKASRERDEEISGLHPTVPEMSLTRGPPRMGGAAAESSPRLPSSRSVSSSAPTVPEFAAPPMAEPEPPAPESSARAKSSRKSRSRSQSSSEGEAPSGALTERLTAARRLVSEGKLDEARVGLERLVSLGVANAPVHTQLGAIYLAQGATERALERFQEALALDPEELDARLYRGEARLARGDLLLAQQDLQHVLDASTAGSPLVQRAQQLLQTLGKERDRKRR